MKNEPVLLGVVRSCEWDRLNVISNYIVGCGDYMLPSTIELPTNAEILSDMGLLTVVEDGSRAITWIGIYFAADQSELLRQWSDGWPRTIKMRAANRSIPLKDYMPPYYGDFKGEWRAKTCILVGEFKMIHSMQYRKRRCVVLTEEYLATNLIEVTQHKPESPLLNVHGFVEWYIGIGVPLASDL